MSVSSVAVQERRLPIESFYSRISKAQVLADVRAEKGAVCNIDMLRLRVYGDAAVVVGRTTWMSAGGNGQYRYTDVYVRRGGRWTCVASQATDIKK
jgi:hypothetical protein